MKSLRQPDKPGRSRAGVDPQVTDCPPPRTLYIQGERRLDFAGWLGAIQKAAASSGDTLSQQQLGDSDIPVIVYRCVDYITQCGERRSRDPCPTLPKEACASCGGGQPRFPGSSEISGEAPPCDQCLGPLTFGPAPNSAPPLSRPDLRGHLPQVWANLEDAAAAGESAAGR